jgi:hypothetical protein
VEDEFRASGPCQSPRDVAIDEDLAGRLVHAAAIADPTSLLTRRQLLGGRLFEPPPATLPEWLESLEEFVQRECFVGVVGAIVKLGAWARGGPTADAAGITGLSATNVCPGTKLTIYGSGFGASQPNDVRVYVPVAGGGCREAAVTGWSNIDVEVELPADIGAGCVGFVRGYAQFVERPDVRGELVSCFGAVGEIWGRGFDKVATPPVPCPPCLPGGENRIGTAGRPVINTFGFSPEQVTPGGQPVLTWNVTNATSVTITRTSQTGPIPALQPPLPHAGQLTLPPIGGLVPVTGTYRLEAVNACGRSQRDAAFTMIARPQLGITRIEVVQSIQTVGNTVRLAANRRTMVRVFVDSGITSGFDFGAGANRVPGIEVSVLAENLDDGSIRGCGSPWTPPEANATPNRDLLPDSANFDVPLAACTGRVRFRATAMLPGSVGAPPLSFATGSVDVSFEPKSSQEVTPFLITDPTNPAPAPTAAQFFDTMQGPMDAQPFPEQPAGFRFNLPPISMTLGLSESLFGPLAWQRFIARFTTMMFLFPSRPVGGIQAGIVNPSAGYPMCGVALPRIAATVPSMLVQAGDAMCCIHELAHTFGLNHINSCGAPWPWDGGLPLTISDPGLNVRARSIRPAGSPEAMSYCIAEWVSIEHWDRVFDRIPIH